MGKIIAIANHKGGTGKTTTALNLAAALVRFHQRKVLLVDLDPQGSLTIFTGLLPEKMTLHVGSVLKQLNQFDKALQDYYLPDLKLLPSHSSLNELIELGEFNKNWKKILEPLLKNALTELLKNAAERFDFVIIDCPPSLGTYTFQAFCTTDALIIPLQCEYLALRGIQLMLKTVEKARAECNANLKILGILPTMYDRRTLHSREVLEEIQSALKGRVNIFSTIIYKTIRFPESAVALLPIFEYDPKNPGAQAYKELAEEVIHHG